MASVYVVQSDGRSILMNPVHCRNEEEELQRLLEQNPDLLPGDQIDQEDPLRWLLIKREMPVPDPGSGSDRWSVDLFFCDHIGVPTLVECKRYADTRARREVVGQMLEYAANGHVYWGRDVILECLRKSHGESARAALESLKSPFMELEDLAAEVAANLLRKKMRLVFFMEEAPRELKSIVEFMNAQMTDVEVLIVEARQYEKDGQRVVVPTLFGFTEQIRAEKAVRQAAAAPSRRAWTEASFFERMTADLRAETVAAARKIFLSAIELGYEISWGKGAKYGTLSPIWAPKSKKSILQVTTEGRFFWNLGWFAEDSDAAIRHELVTLIKDEVGTDLSNEAPNRFPSVDESEWNSKADRVVTVLERFSGKRTRSE